MSSEDLFRSGQLTAAVEAQTQVVKEQPGNAAARVFLFELLCFQDEFERAERQLEVIAKLDPQRDAAVQPYRNLLRAEKQRLKLIHEGVPPVVPGEPPPRLYNHLQAVNRLREQSFSDAGELLDAAETERQELSVEVDGTACDDFRDCDDLFASFFELFVGPEYLWVPMERVRTVQFGRPEQPRDLVWAQANLLMRDGSLLRGFVPVRYVGSGAAERDEIRLGHGTDWSDPVEGPVRGTGQRLFLTGEDARAILDLKTLGFDASDGNG